MKKNCMKQWSFAILSFITMLYMVFPSSGAPARGKITEVDSASISGWAWNPEDTNDVQQVEIHIFRSGKSDPVKYLHVVADQYREDLVADLKDGWHGFSVKVDWSELEGSDFKIKAYTVKDGQYYTLGEAVSYSKGSSKTAQSAAKDTGKSTTKDTVHTAEKASGSASSETSQTASASSEAGQSLGIFSISGYCNCEKCSGGNKVTYSGKTPQANHTIAADLTILPLGSKVRIGNTVYTVEDKGSAIQGHKIDIYYDSHDKARAHGRTSQEVFLLR
ncbi:MAG: hypothetical protein HFG54_07215 [Lachnospiraceae bacterium]|nr:hypothetical protein [Lachnospiraceae bacterium]